MQHDPDSTTKTRADGLRYTSKQNGTPFAGSWGGTMSCFCCGKHMSRTRLASFIVAGKRSFRCREGC